jgi:poly(3-hydroxybutyrate) depolymerase
MNTDERRWAVTVLGLAALFIGWALPVSAATPVPSGKWSFVFTDRKGRADRPMRVYTYRPRQCDTTCPIQFVMHGASRTASNYRDYWELLADRYGFLVIAPEFSARDWPGKSYNLGDVAASPDREKWGYSVVEHLFDEMRDGQKDYRIFGHSAGAQFVHRMLFLLPDNRASVAIMANAGWYTMPEWRGDKAAFKWPYSLVDSPSGEAALRRALERKAWVILGEADTDPNHEQLDKSEGAMKQGTNRLERGENFFGAVTAAATTLGVKLGWQLAYVPGVGHEGQKMSRASAEIAYGARK